MHGEVSTKKDVSIHVEAPIESHVVDHYITLENFELWPDQARELAGLLLVAADACDRKDRK